ncbi:MAG: ATP-binding protein [Bacteroidota bacterium]
MKIGTRFFLTMLCFGLAALGGLIWLFHGLLVPWHTELMFRQARETAQLVQQVRPWLPPNELQRLCEKIKREQKDLSYLVVLDKDGKALSHSDPSRVGMLFGDPGTLKAARDGLPVEQDYRRDLDLKDSPYHGERIRDILLPSSDRQGRHVGAVNVGLSLARIDADRQTYNWLLLGNGLFFGLILVLISFRHFLAALHPIEEMVRVTRAVGEGDFSRRIHEVGRDEIGALSGEINRMLEKLSRSHSELTASEARFRAIFDHAAVGMLQVGLDGKTLLANQHLCDLLGYPLEELWSTPGTKLVPPEDVGQNQEIVERLYAGEVPLLAEKRFVRKDGQIVWTYLAVTLVRDPDDNPLYYLFVIEDATERKKAELALRETEALREIDQAKTHFLYAVTHVLRTPLNAITGFGSELEDGMVGPLNEQQLAYVGHMMNGADRLLRLIDDLLDVARMEAGYFNLEIMEVDPLALVREVLETFLPKFEQKRLTVECDLSPDLPLIPGDPFRIGQVLSNLLFNAMKFTPEGGTIRVQSRVAEERVLVEVSDSGIGIQEADLPKLFTRFYQVQGATKGVRGTGLGLAIAKALVEAHGGSIGVKSQWGEGSTFWFALPLAS